MRVSASLCWAIRLATFAIWACLPRFAAAQDASADRGRLFDFSNLTLGSDSGRTLSILGDALPPAVVLLDMSVPPGIAGTVPIGDSTLWAPKQRITSQPTYLSMFRQDASVGFPILGDGRNLLVGFVDLREVNFRTNARLTDSSQRFPNDLWAVAGGVQYFHKTDEGWTVGGGFSMGSPSDRPYESLRVIVPSMNAFARVPAGPDSDAWLFSITWAPVSVIRFPVPGVAYEWNVSDRLQVVAGVPFSVVWRLTDDLRLDVGYLPPYQMRAQLTQRVLPWMDVFVGFESVSDAYLLAERQRRRDLFYSYEKRLPAGLRFDIGKHVVLDAVGGYLFNRHYFSSASFFDESRDRVHIAPSAYLMLRLAIKF